MVGLRRAKMPNWCSNIATLRHEDKSLIDKIEQAEGVLQALIPCPEELNDDELTTSYGDEDKQKAVEAKRAEMVKKYGHASWYDWNIANWGTKWDLCEVNKTRIDANTIQLNFDTAWSPPVEAYDKLMGMDFEVLAYYFEPGMCFAGIYDNGNDDCYSDWGDSRGARATLPQELDDTFGISESQEEWERENEEELTSWIREGAEAVKEGQ